MKNLIAFFFLTFILFNSSFGQLTKGNWMVGGTGSFSTGSYSELGADYHFNKVAVSPSIAYLISERVPIGLRFVVSNFHITSVGPAPGTTGVGNDFNLTFGPFARYYFFKNLESPVNFFIEGNYGVGYTTDISRIKKYLNRYSFITGPVYYINNNIGLEFSIGYYHSSQYNTATTGLEVSIGFQIHLIKEKNVY